jgi:hypothetical protein
MDLLGRYEEAIHGIAQFATDHVHQYRQAASQFLAGTYDVAAFEKDVKTCVGRMLQLPRTVGGIGLGFLDGGSCAPAVVVDIEVQSARRTEGKISLTPASQGSALLALPLYTTDRSAAPIENALFVVKEGSRLVLVVKVPDQQPLGTYTGAIVDARTHEPLGAVTIKVIG